MSSRGAVRSCQTNPVSSRYVGAGGTSRLRLRERPAPPLSPDNAANWRDRDTPTTTSTIRAIAPITPTPRAVHTRIDHTLGALPTANAPGGSGRDAAGLGTGKARAFAELAVRKGATASYTGFGAFGATVAVTAR